MATKKYAVNWKLEHDGKEYAAGADFSIDEKLAVPLLESGVISDPKQKASEGQGE